MSTMSSQLLITSSALIEDLYRIFKKQPSKTSLLVLSRSMVVAVAVVAMLMAFNPSDTILGLVGFAWAGFGAAFGPVVIASLYWRRLTAPGAIVGMIVGAVTVFIWGAFFSDIIYELVPGFILASVAMVIVSLLTTPARGVEEEFDRAIAVTEQAVHDPNETFQHALEDTPRTETPSP